MDHRTIKAKDIFVDYESTYPVELMYGSKIMIYLCDTAKLCHVADDLRKELGGQTFFANDNDPMGWYEFYIFYDEMFGGLDGYLWFDVIDYPPDTGNYKIQLTEEELEDIFREINRQCKEYTGRTLKEEMAFQKLALKKKGE